MKNNIFNLLMFIFLVQPMKYAVAADNLSVSQVDSILAKQLKRPSDFSPVQRYYGRGHIDEARVKLDQGMITISAFLKTCLQSHYFLTSFPEDEAELDFYQQTDSFEEYVGGHWYNDGALRDFWFRYYINGALHFLNQQDTNEAQGLFLKANEIADIRNPLIILMKRQAIATQYSLYNQAAGIWASFYENLREAQSGAGFDAIDCIILAQFYGKSRNVEKSIEYGLRALNMPWPSVDNPLYQLQIDQEKHIKNIGIMYAESGRFEEAKNILLLNKGENLEPGELLAVAGIYAMEGDFKKSFEFLKSSFSSISIQSYVLYVPRPAAIALLEMLSKRSNLEFNEYCGSLFLALSTLFPHASFEKIIKPAKKFIKPNFNALRKALATDIFDRTQLEYIKIDNRFKKLWVHSSFLPESQMSEILSNVQNIATQIDVEYKLLMQYAGTTGSAEEFSKIREQSDYLFEKMAASVSVIKQADHKISLLRRSYYRQQQCKRGNNESFLILPKSTKAEILAEQKEQDKKNQERLESAKVYKAQRQEVRAEKGRAYKKSASPVLAHQEVINNKPELNIGSMDSELAVLWKTGQLPEQAFEILEALASVSSIFELRSRLRPGTKLEILQGDRKAQVSLRVNDQYRVCFYWIPGKGPCNIEMVDYHRS